jgi:hypothetical protein
MTCTHPTFEEHTAGRALDERKRPRDQSRLIWVCSKCGDRGFWSDGWGFRGVAECVRCGLANIDKVLCPQCGPRRRA